ncbi:MAG: hypothetical protein A2505_02215 [Deltaproteobacteria bacterium RIFOXYD12_FULL_55_16]|nr:MAG: hypothetical protein A2505_02215 [Deltaproteobacteria bacterium RIFOXYD12_FULL_55_16]
MNIRKLKRGLASTKKQILSDQLAFITMIHFPGIEMSDDVSCADCQDFCSGVCPGEGRKGEAVLDCMMKHLEGAEFSEHLGPLPKNR